MRGSWTGQLADDVVGFDGTHPTLDVGSGAFVTVPYNPAGMAEIVTRIEALGLPYEISGLMLLMADADVLAGRRRSA